MKIGRQKMPEQEFKLFIYLSVFVLLLEVAGGFYTNSLALLSDAGHVLTDLIALSLAFFSMRVAKKKPTAKFTYGFHRAEIFAALLNGLLLLGAISYIFYNAYQRLLSPQPIKGTEMLVISVLGLVANIFVVVRMHRYSKQNLNVRGAYLHVLSDTFSSAGVIIAGGLIVVTGIYVFDPLVSILIGLLVLLGSVQLIRESVSILMESMPQGINIEELIEDIQKIKGVEEVHDLHVWSLSSEKHALSAHVLVDVENMKSVNKIVEKINGLLKTRYNITHTVIQSECEKCASNGAH